ncbi:transporter associated domain-containing protein, partial [Salmonella enterica]|uniref:transporter associated domain-containing protein n=1 Tax=Salmonella enterica TaxID=28901 RepID=UPI002E147ED7
EEIVGNILDEYDEEENPISKIDENKYIIIGNIPIHELNQELDLKLDEENNEYDTIAGLIVSKIDRIPSPKDQIELDIDDI